MNRITSPGFIVASLLAVLICACTRHETASHNAGNQPRAPAEIITEQSVGSGFDLANASLVGTGSLLEEMQDGTENFSNHSCTENCTGHEAGYAWAEQQGVTDPNDCGGESNSFLEGCMVYAAEQRGDRDTQDD